MWWTFVWWRVVCWSGVDDWCCGVVWWGGGVWCGGVWCGGEWCGEEWCGEVVESGVESGQCTVPGLNIEDS